MTHITALLNARNLDKFTRVVADRLRNTRGDAAWAERELSLLVPDKSELKEARPETWSLEPPALHIYRCGRCGAHWLRPQDCCGRRARRTHAAFYVPSGTTPPAGALDFSVIMLTRNNLPLTMTAVESLRRARGSDAVEFIFVDCCSTDGSLSYFQELARKETVRVIVTPPEERFVYSRNCNRGAQAARGRFLLFANNDIEAQDPHLFAKLGRALSDLRVGVVGTLTDTNQANELQHQPSLPLERVWSVKPVMGFLWGVRAEVFAELNGMDEDYRDYGCDEIDFQYRAIRRNYRIAIVDSMVHHELLATFGPNIVRSLLRNIARFNAKHQCRLFDLGRWYYPFLAHRYPRLSVAVACRNHGRYLARALDSALGNALPAEVGRQVVVVNDASVDETVAVLEEYRRRYPSELNALHRPVSHGPAAAKNEAMARCIGEFVALLDADDEFLETKLARCLETLEESGSDLLYHDFLQVLPDGREECHRVGTMSVRRWRGGRNLPPSTWMFRAGTVRFCESYPAGEDPEFLKRNWNTLRSVYLPEALTRYHVHGGGLSLQPLCQVITRQLRGERSATVLDGSILDFVREIEG